MNVALFICLHNRFLLSKSKAQLVSHVHFCLNFFPYFVDFLVRQFYWQVVFINDTEVKKLFKIK